MEDLRPALLQLFGDDPLGPWGCGGWPRRSSHRSCSAAGSRGSSTAYPRCRPRSWISTPIEILRPRPHHDLLREMVIPGTGRGGRQWPGGAGGCPRRRCVGEQGGLVLGGGHVPQELHPDGEGEHVPGHGTAHKVCPVGPLFRGLPLASLWGAGAPAPGRGPPAPAHRRNTPCLGRGIEEPLRHQLGIGTLHSDGAHPQVFGKTPFGGQLLPCPEFFWRISCLMHR